MTTGTSAHISSAPRRAAAARCCARCCAATGVAGNPLEHFEVLRALGPAAPAARVLRRASRTPSVLDLLAPLEPAGGPTRERAGRLVGAHPAPTGRRRNGVWGGKLMWGHVDDLVARARELPGLAGADLGRDRCARCSATTCRLVYVTRPDKVAQAVSLWRAVQTQTWRAGRGTPTRRGARTTSRASTTSSAPARGARRGVARLVRRARPRAARGLLRRPRPATRARTIGAVLRGARPAGRRRARARH